MLKDYKNSDLDALAWLCKALSMSGNSSYKAALEEAATNSGNKKLTKYAKRLQQTSGFL